MNVDLILSPTTTPKIQISRNRWANILLMMLMEIGERGLRRKIAEPFKTVPCFLHPLQGALGKVVQEKKDWTLFATAGSRLLG